MLLYKLWREGEKLGTNYLVAAEYSDDAKNLVCMHLAKYGDTQLLDTTVWRVGFPNEFEKSWVSVWTDSNSNSWWSFKVHQSALQAFRGAKRPGVLAEFKP